MGPVYSKEELIEISRIINKAKVSTVTSNIPFYIGQNNLITYINESIIYWTKELTNKSNVNPSFSENAIHELKRLKVVLFCNIEELPLNIHGKFEEIVRWRFKKINNERIL